MRLFNDGNIDTYVDKNIQNMKDEIARFSDAEIIGCDFEQWANYFESKYSIAPITVFEDSVNKTMCPAKVRRYNHDYDFDHNMTKYILIDGYTIKFTVHFDGDPQLFFLTGSTFLLTTFEAGSFKDPSGDECGSFTLEFSYSESELANQSDVNAYVQKQYNSRLNDFKAMIGHNNSYVEQFNAQLHAKAIRYMTERKQKASNFAALSQALNIPMRMSDNAPNIVPIPLKRVVKAPIAKPSCKPAAPEYCISDADYSNIINIIHSACCSMERTPRTFNQHSEEELRDFTLAFLETHYENKVSGETFRKNGKTDIHVSFENKAAFIGECKIWHGIKKFDDAIKQLFGYSMWRDTKTELIIFNKENKDFLSIRTTVMNWIQQNTKSHVALNSNVWKCVMYRSDTNTDVQVVIAIYDLAL